MIEGRAAMYSGWLMGQFRFAAVSVCLGVGLVVEHQIRPGIKYSWAPNAAKH